ncbi:MAG: DUF5050 domain-containing protein [Eubacteriales bacterium]|nr:DUF5050 domain-containing protein [Eubacteriales bacterium]
MRNVFIYLLLFCVLFFTACNKKNDVILESSLSEINDFSSKEPSKEPEITSSSSNTIIPSSSEKKKTVSSKINTSGFASSTSKAKSPSTTISNEIKYKNNIKGNSNGNLINLGLVSRQNEWIFYSNFSDGGKLYKKRIDGSEKTLLSNDTCRQINVVGDWVYYCNESDKNIYKVKIDGTEKINLQKKCLYYMYVEGDWIYFENIDQSGFSKMKIDGSEFSIIFSDQIWSASIANEWIYYSNESGDDSDYRNLYKIDINGKNKTIIDKTDNIWASIPIGNIVYYERGCGEFFKINSDGSEKLKIAEVGHEGFNISGDWLFYGDIDDEMGYRIKLDGSSKSKIINDYLININIIDDWIYYTVYESQNVKKMYRIRFDGSNKQLFD